jgi:hypothetical protein
MYTLLLASKKMKFAVHWAPAVRVWTPGRIVAEDAGAHEGAALPEEAPAPKAAASAKHVSAATDKV